MTAKSIFLTAAAAAGMVAVADVWDIKFTLKTVQNDKKVSVTLKGAWDDAVDGQYSFWDNKTKVALKDVAFLTAGAKAYSNGRNQGSNAQLVWGGLENPQGLLVAGGFGSLKSQSGQVVGTYGGAPASGTWSMKKASARKTFDSLNKGGSVDAKANAALKKEAEFVLAEALKDDSATSETKQQIEDLTKQVAAVQEAAAKEVAAAKAEAADANARAAGADEATKKAEEATAAADKAKEELAEANKALDELAAVTNAIAQTLSDAANNEGLVEEARTLFETEVRNYIDNTLYKATLTLGDGAESNVTNSMLAVSNRLAAAIKALADLETKTNALGKVYHEDYAGIPYSNDLKTVYYPLYDTITNTAAYRDKVLDGSLSTIAEASLNWKAVNLIAETNTAYVAMTNAMTNVVVETENLKAANDWVETTYGWYVTDSTPGNLATWEAAVRAAKYAETNDLYIATTNKDQMVKNYDAAVAAIAGFKDGNDIKELTAKIADLNKKLDDVIKEAKAMTVGDFTDKFIPNVIKEAAGYTETITTLTANLEAWDNTNAGVLTVDYDKTVDMLAIGDTFDQLAWDDGAGGGQYGFIKDQIRLADASIAKNEANIKGAQDLANLLSVDSFATEKYTASLDTYYAWELGQKDLAPVVIEAAAKWGITLKAKE